MAVFSRRSTAMLWKTGVWSWWTTPHER